MRLLYDVALGLWASLRETFPADTDEAGPFVAGMTWAFVIHWVLLITVTLAWYGGHR